MQLDTLAAQKSVGSIQFHRLLKLGCDGSLHHATRSNEASQSSSPDFHSIKAQHTDSREKSWRTQKLDGTSIMRGSFQISISPEALILTNISGNLFGAGANPFGAFPPAGMTPAATPPAPGSAGQGTPGADAAAANPFASMFGGAGAGANPFGMTPEMMQQAMAAFGGGGMFGGPGMLDLNLL